MRLAFRTDASESQLRLMRQIGVTDAVAGRAPDATGVWSLGEIRDLKRRIEDHGMTLSVIELVPIPDGVKCAAPGRDEDIDDFAETVRNLGRAGVPALAYNWMAGFSWFRTSVDTPVRGGARSTAYNHDAMHALPRVDIDATAEQLWDGITYFLRAVVPVAEEAGVRLALHPDDPPLSPVRGVTRIITSPDALQRVLDTVPSPANGLTLCQGCLCEMGADVTAQIHRFVEQGRVVFAHFRNIRGTGADFVETFHDDGQLDMYRVMKAYHDAGFDGPIRPDHAPTLEGEDNDNPGYAIQGRILAIGYMRGLIEAINKCNA